MIGGGGSGRRVEEDALDGPGEYVWMRRVAMLCSVSIELVYEGKEDEQAGERDERWRKGAERERRRISR